MSSPGSTRRRSPGIWPSQRGARPTAARPEHCSEDVRTLDPCTLRYLREPPTSTTQRSSALTTVQSSRRAGGSAGTQHRCAPWRGADYTLAWSTNAAPSLDSLARAPRAVSPPPPDGAGRLTGRPGGDTCPAGTFCLSARFVVRRGRRFIRGYRSFRPRPWDALREGRFWIAACPGGPARTVGYARTVSAACRRARWLPGNQGRPGTLGQPVAG
jgi:hypothetical protein